MPLSEFGYCVAIPFKITERVEQQRICIRFCIKVEHSSMETVWMIHKAAVMGKSWLTASSWQCIMSYAEFFAKTSNHPGDSDSLQPRYGNLRLLPFPKTKIIFEREEISDFDEIQENTMGQLMMIRRTVWGPKEATLKGTEASLSCVQCFLYLLQ